jgi:acyl-CoA hydrolase
MYEREYKAKLMSARAAADLIPARGTLSMGTAVSEPPALLAALENRVKAGAIEELRVYYSHSVAAAVTIKSILAACSTANNGKISRIVPKIKAPTTDPRADPQYIVTEYGVADMSGKSTTERAETLIGIHPDFRDDLRRRAKAIGYL